jgi:formate hydrogenlyase subunit 6/NADH:ubiquinone oxidoreductase subunit I
MKLGVMINDILASAFKRPITERYPFERKAAPIQLRGKLLWNRAACTGCGLCAKDCPSNAIDVIVIDRKARQFVFNYRVDHCLFCAQCVHSCRQGCLQMQSDVWELAALNRDGYQLMFGAEADVNTYLAGVAAGGEEPAAEPAAQPKLATEPVSAGD